MRLTFALALLFAPLAAVFAADDPWKLDEKFKAAKPEDLKDAEGTKPPKDAIILFDGKDFSKWTKTNGKDEVKWTLRDGGIMEGVKGHGDIMTKDKFTGSFKLHVEFRVPYEPAGAGQGRGNSGVYVQGRYEVQVLDSYGLKPGKNDCGAIYEVAAPKENACKAPTVWQAYDIEFTAPKFENGKKTEPARMTVTHNGIKIHDDVPIPVDNTRAGLGGDPATPGPIMLQDHGHPVQFRNVWLLPIK
jgi:3-keto-disaccharide hydrolase